MKFEASIYIYRYGYNRNVTYRSMTNNKYNSKTYIIHQTNSIVRIPKNVIKKLELKNKDKVWITITKVELDKK